MTVVEVRGVAEKEISPLKNEDGCLRLIPNEL